MSENNYERKILYQNKFFEVISIQWTNSSFSCTHNHGWSQCSILVEEGIFENTLDMGNKVEIQRLEVGQGVETPIAGRHELKCLTPTGKTLHVYTPKIIEHSDNGRFTLDHEIKDKLKAGISLDHPTDISTLKDTLDLIRQSSVATHSPYFMNQLFSGVMPQMLMAEELINQTKTTMATYEASPAFSLIEMEVIEGLGHAIGWEVGFRDGISVPGGSAANSMAIHCARQKYFPHIKAKGMSGEKLKVFVSSEAHYSFKKSCVSLGLGTDSLIQVSADSEGRMKPEVLLELIKVAKESGETPFFVSATAGTTVLGAFDNISELAKVCREYGVWLHVDGAWGGPALFSKKLRPLIEGVEQADSMTFDAHKLFGANLTCSFFLTKHKGLLQEANDVSGGDYLFHENNEGIDRGKMSWQCGRRADATSFWTIWKSLGTAGLEQFIDRLIEVREETLDWIKTQPRLKLISTPEFLNVCVRVIPPNEDIHIVDWSKKVREELKEQNLAMVNYSTNKEGDFLRLILANPFLKFKHVKQILAWALEIK